MQQSKTDHQSSLTFILFGTPDENPDSTIEEHIQPCTNCQEVLKRVLTPTGRRLLEYVHPDPQQLFLYAYPKYDLENSVTEEDRQSIEHHLTLCASCREEHEEDSDLATFLKTVPLKS